MLLQPDLGRSVGSQGHVRRLGVTRAETPPAHCASAPRPLSFERLARRHRSRRPGCSCEWRSRTAGPRCCRTRGAAATEAMAAQQPQ
jgi:hypothetical protein